MSQEEVEHWFYPQENIIDTFVVENANGEVTDFLSLYTLPSTIMNHPTHKSLKAAYSFYNVHTQTPLLDLMSNALVLAKMKGFDVFNALDLMENKTFLEKLKFEKDLLSLEQDAVFGLESLLVLCSQDDSPGAQFTVKIALNCVVKLAKGWPHLSRSVVDTLLTQLHISQDTARFLMCHCLAAIAMQLPVLDDRMLGDFMELYKQIGLQPQQAQQPLKPQPQQQPQNAYTRF
ncbi:Glycylpeptide N-tetradecanoyltransferase 1 [Cricetulus griseus]|uniref:Glycylpeptide N-tetradecanoyltransferase n=1 Tax=Cricetulus griseus TaxID=10029 RepID=G3HZ81_CRIGR|nr:Glycylpeptide N-tetradecanoyltransferase 1 [Cricetulus griseus]